MKIKQVKTLADLRAEKQKLTNQLKDSERQLNESWGYLKSNYKGMIWQQINPFKMSNVANIALDLLQPGLLPLITEVVKGTTKGSPINMKVIASAVKYALANLGIKWLHKWLDKKEDDHNEEEEPVDDESFVSSE